MPMLTYRFVYSGGWPAHMTTTQYEAACVVANRFNMTHTVEVDRMFGGDGAIIINTGTMRIVVEPDGHTHS